ncbi:MAG: hypothetical protein JRI68_13485 [Deltaproteobacteria bacterium]|nr:hypothetical protein [Deltaproteobacteria bacterium]
MKWFTTVGLGVLGLGLAAACGTDGDGVPAGTAGNGGSSTGGEGGTGTGGSGGTSSGGGTAGSGGGTTPCPDGVTCVDTFPFTDQRDTSSEGETNLDGYSCSPNTDESGPEILYRVTVPAAGFLSTAVYEQGNADIDVHILSDLDAAACLDRGNFHARVDVDPGTVWIVADTFASNGQPQVGAFQIDIGFVVPSVGPCGMEVGEMARVNDGGNHLPMPATGPMVLEAHLVTQEEPAPYPSTSTEELSEHYLLSQDTTEFIMHRSQHWAPLEGGSFYGCGIGSPDDFPVLHEAWYVNMYWTSAARPAKGTRMILREPNNGSRAVVVAAGYETGPGNLAHIGGTPEEPHFYLRTSHLGELQLGIATDQALPFGPRICQ